MFNKFEKELLQESFAAGLAQFQRSCVVRITKQHRGRWSAGLLSAISFHASSGSNDSIAPAGLG
jgi:hypothetical protein